MTTEALDFNDKGMTSRVPKYGNDLAFHLACEERKQMLEYLNNNGMQYSETHGQ